VPNISFGAAVMKSLNGRTQLPYDVHLMIEQPDQYIEDFVTPQTEYITVHQEACVHLHRTLQHIHSAGAKAGVSINPATPLCAVEEVLPDLDGILVMTVNPGFAGQKLVPQTLDKIRRLRGMLDARGYTATDIEVDGNVSFENAKLMSEAGANIFVAGTSSIFSKSGTTADNARRLREAVGN
jgi:ribulose-phosphate 3-epimerase